jgi:hypothetical protein
MKASHAIFSGHLMELGLAYLTTEKKKEEQKHLFLLHLLHR